MVRDRTHISAHQEEESEHWVSVGDRPTVARFWNYKFQVRESSARTVWRKRRRDSLVRACLRAFSMRLVGRSTKAKVEL